MQFALTEDQIAVRDMARDFAAEKIAPHAIRWDEEKHFPVDVMREAARLGIDRESPLLGRVNAR